MSGMKRFHARELADWSVESIWAMPDERFILVFDDGEIETYTRATILSWYFHEFHRQYPATPMLIKHHLQDRELTSGLQRKLLGTNMFSTYEAYHGEVDIETLCKLVYQVTNSIYNDMTGNLSEYISTMSALDLLELVDHPAIKAANDTVRPTQLSIDQTYEKIEETIMRDPTLSDNRIARMCQSGLVRMPQVLQMIGPRGYCTDIDSNIFKKPILRGFANGMYELVDSMMESGSARKNLMYAKNPLAKTEYFNRELQLEAATFQRLHYCDCGTTKYLPFQVRKGDLHILEGKYHLEEGKLKEIMADDKYLIGKVIQLRSIFECIHPDPVGVCSTCFGALALSIPRDTNAGHVSVTEICGRVSQNVLSTKHLDGSSTVGAFVVFGDDKNFIRSTKEGLELAMSEKLVGKEVFLYVAPEFLPNISDIHHVPDVKTLSITRTSSIREVVFGVVENGVERLEPVLVSMGSRWASFTKEFLGYVKKRGLEMTDLGLYRISLSSWRGDESIFALPMKHLNTLDFMETVKSTIKRTASKRQGKSDMVATPETLNEALVELHDLLSTKFSMNIVHLESVIYSSLIRNSDNHDYRLPAPNGEREFGTYNGIMASRSFGATMALDKHTTRILHPLAFTVKVRPSHPMDEILMPR